MLRCSSGPKVRKSLEARTVALSPRWETSFEARPLRGRAPQNDGFGSVNPLRLLHRDAAASNDLAPLGCFRDDEAREIRWRANGGLRAHVLETRRNRGILQRGDKLAMQPLDDRLRRAAGGKEG